LENGCETELGTLTDCADCGDACADGNGSASCNAGSCEITCDVGYDDCDSDSTNGCETALGTLTDCGACAAACGGENASAECVDLGCVLTCNDGFGNCDADASTGCEAALGTLLHCGSCDQACGEINGTAECLLGDCVLTCNPGFDDCDNDPSTGCETAIDTIDNCGECGKACSQLNATPVCADNQCEITCDPDYLDCDQDVDTGCEGDLGANPNCGECGILCAGLCNDGVCEVCDDALPIESLDPLDAARAIGLCADVVSAEWVLPDGSPPPVDSNYALGHGLLDGFGPNLSVRHGHRMLVLSSGTARRPDDPGYQTPNGFDKGYTCNHPLGFPKESPSCPGVVTGEAHDAVALKVTLQVPPNVHGFSYHFDFYTYEWPGFICSAFNDFFVSLLVPFPSGQSDGNIAFDAQGNPVSVNNSFLEVCACPDGPPCTAGGRSFSCVQGGSQLIETGFGIDTEEENHAATGWLINKAPVEPDSTVTLTFAIYDSGDGVLDSTVLIDNFHWLTDPSSVVTEPDPDP